MIRKILILLINWYQKTISPDHGYGRVWGEQLGCRFYPSCSEYAKQALSKKKLVIALYLIFRRIVRCHPFAKGGYDPI